jgi:hypothetical protein
LLQGATPAAGSGDRLNPLALRAPQFPAKAKSIISIFCYGGVSHVDTFDPKPESLKRQGETMAGKGNVVVSQGNPGGLMPSPWEFRQHGQSGIAVSSLFPMSRRRWMRLR